MHVVWGWLPRKAAKPAEEKEAEMVSKGLGVWLFLVGMLFGAGC